MADERVTEHQGHQTDLQKKILKLRREVVTLEVIDHELSSVGTRRVYTKEDNNDLFFLADKIQTVSQYKKKLDDTKKELALLERPLNNPKHKS